MRKSKMGAEIRLLFHVDSQSFAKISAPYQLPFKSRYALSRWIISSQILPSVPRKSLKIRDLDALITQRSMVQIHPPATNEIIRLRDFLPEASAPISFHKRRAAKSGPFACSNAGKPYAPLCCWLPASHPKPPEGFPRCLGVCRD